MSDEEVQVLPYRGQWVIRLGGIPQGVFPMQADAIKQARSLAQLHRADLLICGPDGRIVEKHRYRVDSQRRDKDS